MTRFNSGATTLHTTDLNTASIIKIGAVTDLRVELETETQPDDSGSFYDEARSIISQLPTVEWTSKAIGDWLTWIGLEGYCIASDGTHPGLQVYGNVLGDCKDPPLSTDNVRYTVPTGLIVLGSLRMPRGRDAELSLMCHAITDGTNAPLSSAYGSITLPTGLAVAQYTLGHCQVGNVVLTDLADATLNFGVQIAGKTPAQGSVWADSVAARKCQPMLTLSGFDPRVLDDATGIPQLGKQATHAQTLIQLKKRAGYAAFVADATEEHIAITMGGLAKVTTAFGAAGNSESSTVIVVEGVHDGTNAPLTWDVASAYTQLAA